MERTLEGLANNNVLTVYLLKFHFALACSAVGIRPAQRGYQDFDMPFFHETHGRKLHVSYAISVMHYVIHLFTHLIGFLPLHCPFKHVHMYVYYV